MLNWFWNSLNYIIELNTSISFDNLLWNTYMKRKKAVIVIAGPLTLHFCYFTSGWSVEPEIWAVGNGIGFKYIGKRWRVPIALDEGSTSGSFRQGLYFENSNECHTTFQMSSFISMRLKFFFFNPNSFLSAANEIPIFFPHPKMQVIVIHFGLFFLLKGL